MTKLASERTDSFRGAEAKTENVHHNANGVTACACSATANGPSQKSLTRLRGGAELGLFWSWTLFDLSASDFQCCLFL